ncbi:TPA: hypothetical protein TVN79_002055 [Streptococcus equi subsp. zooepidemicus]|nr:hypothetical protein [Streptococcus equi subsp. zooepidemicus]HEL1236343.1 hypothetical protein [Streptococcus equi subsp. zooepidemicus]
MTQEQLIDEFLNGATEGICGGSGNLKIKGDKLVHYQTAIAERYGEKIIINVTRYSLVTGRLQKMLNQKVAEEKQIIARRVKEGHNGSLVEFTDISGEN